MPKILRQFLWFLVICFLLYLLATQPTQSAHDGAALFHGIKSVFQGGATFIDELRKAGDTASK